MVTGRPPVGAWQTAPVANPGWEWDPTLFGGSAPYYAEGRASYPEELIDALVAALDLDGTGRLLDLGCGPGSLTLPLAWHVGEAVGLDADAAMVTEGRRRALLAGLTNVTWVVRRAEEMGEDLGRFRLVTLAQAFHWMDRPLVARAVRGVLEPGGVVVHVHATTHRGLGTHPGLEHPQPSWDAIEKLVARFLGKRRRAGQGFRTAPTGSDTGEDEEDIYAAAGFRHAGAVETPRRVLTRTADQIVASVLSLSYAAPHLFGDRLDEFEAALRALLAEASPDGLFSEEMREIVADAWRPEP